MRYTLFFILFLVSLGALAQEGPVLLIPEEDSVVNELPEAKSHLLPELPLLNNDLLTNGLPVYAFNPYQNYQQPFVPSFDFKSIPFQNFSTEFIGFGSPFFMNGQVLSGSVTKVNDKFTIGGFSYGANSIMSAPLPNQTGHSFDSYGSTMFMQYKVSKNFKIETRVSVGQNQGPPPPGF